MKILSSVKHPRSGEKRAYIVPTANQQKVKYSFLKILTGSDLSRRRLPFMAIESVRPGPVVWLTGCIHGDEVTGIVTIQEVFKNIRKQPLRNGSLYAFPLMNPIGFETASRNITPALCSLTIHRMRNINPALCILAVWCRFILQLKN